MSTPFLSSLRSSMGATGANAIVSAAPHSTVGKSAMMSLFSDLDLALDASGAVVSGGSAAKDLLASKNAEKQAEAEEAARHALRKEQQQKQQQQKKEQPVTALSQAIGFFDQEMDERDAFTSRNTKRRKGKRGTSVVRGRRQRHEKYQRV
ncbi:hypothetical protein PHMEG_0004471 [Phytophthora megakarya]|uniref:Uncharacterized protein n=1 Tax=Phytophthora megakarya TaxID=4795 RepID=A0A225WTR9_9STRA|nr:hypothetical protein PHMEG_0004471 [Phytophthora megakarya]